MNLRLGYSRIGLALCVVLLMATVACRDDHANQNTPPPTPTVPDSVPTLPAASGIGLLLRMQGIWNGSLVSGTRLGSFPEWVVDFRAISPSQLSGKSELDAQNDIFLGLFPAVYQGDTTIVLRNGGLFNSMNRISYCGLDSVSETPTLAYYRLVDLKGGAGSIKAEYRFWADSVALLVHVRGNFHFEWRAQRLDTTHAHGAAQAHGYPTLAPARVLTGAFDNLSSATFYNPAADAYPAQAHPQLGSLRVAVGKTGSISFQANDRLVVMATADSLWSGFAPNLPAIRKRSRYVVLSPQAGQGSAAFVYTYMHPGTYYLNAFVDRNANGWPDSGEPIVFGSRDHRVTLAPLGAAHDSLTLDLLVP